MILTKFNHSAKLIVSYLRRKKMKFSRTGFEILAPKDIRDFVRFENLAGKLSIFDILTEKAQNRVRDSFYRSYEYFYVDGDAKEWLKVTSDRFANSLKR